MSVGVEEEYQLVDAETCALRPGSKRVLPAAAASVGDQVEPELHEAQIEIGTKVCRTLDEVRAELARLRTSVAAAAETEGFRLVAAGTHPFAERLEQRVTEKAAYAGLAEKYGHLASEQLVFGCHVHVSVEDPDRAIQVMNRARPWLPALLALSASSPFWEGADTSYASYRTEVFGRWPTAGTPSRFESRADYDQMVDELMATQSIDDPARLYWDVRPSARYPTLEFRIADVCTSIDDAVLLAALVRGLVETCGRQAAAGDPEPNVRPELLRSAKWRAARYGLTDELIDLDAMRAVPAHEVVHKLANFARAALEDAGDWDLVEWHLARLLARGTSAERQRARLAESQCLSAVVAWLVDETCAGC